jgi:hypothetical protein
MSLSHYLKFFPYLIYRALRKFHEEYRYEQYRNNYEISPSFFFNGYVIRLYENGRAILGDKSYIGRG